MAAWTDAELHRIGAAPELDIAPVRRNGELRRATPISINDAEHRATTLRLTPAEAG